MSKIFNHSTLNLENNATIVTNAFGIVERVLESLLFMYALFPVHYGLL